jgi:thiol-disulfide isomerase/thioredoxin
VSCFIAYLTLSTTNYALAKEPALIHSETGRTLTLRQLKDKHPKRPLLVMLWATHCKPCMIEGRFMSMVTERFEDQLHFAAIQVDEGVSMSSSSARKVHKKLLSKLEEFGVPRGAQLPEPYLSDRSDKIWLSLQRGSKFNSHNTSIPLFALFDRDRELVKIWTQAIYEDRQLVISFLKSLEQLVEQR